MTFPFSGSGYYELIGSPASGKTTVAALLAVNKLWSGRSVFATTPEENGQVLEHIQGDLPILEIETVKEFFGLVECMEQRTLLVMDSLVTLRPDHPSKVEIASSIARYWVKPKGVVFVVNQERYPVPSGGTLWRSQLLNQFVLEKHRDRPFLISELKPTGLWLTWVSGEPVLRQLSREEEKLWISGVVYDGVCRCSEGIRD